MCNAKEFWLKEGEKKGEKKGVKKGEKKGEKKGIKIGKEQGIKIGEERAQRKSLKQGIQLGITAMVTGLLKKDFSLEEVIELLQEQFQLSRREAMRQAKKAMA